MLSGTSAQAVIHYVSLSGGNTPPYTNWVTAATNIQYAIDRCASGDVVVVTNGTYNTGGRRVGDATTNRVAITNAITVRSVNGPAVTVIRGRATNGSAAVRCVYVGGRAILSGFTLTNGATSLVGDYSTDMSGGGVWCATGGVVSNCLFVENTAEYSGGGASGGSLYNCTFSGNAAFFGGGVIYGTLFNCALVGNNAAAGGGAYDGTLNNCTLSGNSAIFYGGGIEYGTLNNCLLYYNTAPGGANWGGSTLRFCCTTPHPGTEGCFTDEPALASASHLSQVSPCLGRGSATNASGRDIDGEPWKLPPSVGCDEVYSGAVTGALRVALEASFTNVAIGFSVPLTARIEGAASRSAWAFGDGTILSNRPYASHAWDATGNFTVVLTAWNDSNPAGVLTSVNMQVREQQVRYVVMSNAAAAVPFDAWSNAAARIQDAVDASEQIGGLVLVSNGVYDTGGRAVFGTMTNRVAMPRPLVVRSVNGPGVTAIRGQGPAGTNGVRCAYVTDGAQLSGFTLTNGASRIDGDPFRENTGGGVWCETGGMVSNCTISGNSGYEGGGSFQGTLDHCTLAGNEAYEGGGAFQGALNDCTLSDNAAVFGGGADWVTLTRCTLIGNYASNEGGGADNSDLRNCILSGNSAVSAGGGSAWSTLYNCTLARNSAGTSGGGVYEGVLYNCIVYSNTAPSAENHDQSTFDHSCTTPAPAGAGNITNDPVLVYGDAYSFDLCPISPCIDSGLLPSWLAGTTDVAGRPRVMNGRVDMGAHEFRFEATLQGLITGAWIATNASMRTGYPATNSPYAAGRVVVSNVPVNAVDWVLISVRESPTSAPAASVSAFLLPDGRIVGTDGGSNVFVEAKRNLYGVLQHRNHLAVMSEVPVFTNRIVSFDFSADPNLLWGGTNAVIQVSTNKWGMVPGDADGDGEVRAVDEAIRKSQSP